MRIAGKGGESEDKIAWVPSYWAWLHPGYVWVPGRYAAPPSPAYVWISPYWAPTIIGHIWIGGHWRIR